jgi:mannose-1-phosphate guanylyltransferase/mannose-6-phosphate isomerase
MKIIPMVLSGGSGTRLWPLSRASKPKQFLSLGTRHSLFQETVLRCRAPVFDSRPIVVGADSHRFLIAEDLREIGVAADILLEPVARNSCAAIAAGCLAALKRDPDATVLALAADHHIPDARAFCEAVAKAVPDALSRYIVTFGVKPDTPSTAYGYILAGTPIIEAFTVGHFIEKPEREVASACLSAGYLWNSGNFLFRAVHFLAELKRLRPDILESVARAVHHATTDLDFLRLEAHAFAKVPSISVDHAVMERTPRAAVLPVSYRWSDVGNWSSLAGVLDKDARGNATIGDVEIGSGSNNLVHSHGRLTALVGVDDTVVVTTPDVVLVAGKAHAEAVKELVASLKASGRPEAGESLQVFRPWGNYERLDLGTRYQVKRIVVKPGGVLSLQRHRHRAEHWVVVDGRAEVTIGDTVETLGPNESVYVPLGAVHRLANRGTMPVVLIEVQTGNYLGEDDIERLADDYNRAPAKARKAAAETLAGHAA